MNLLLLLSALLSALTGAVPGVRRADVPQAIAQGLAPKQAGQAIAARRVFRPTAAVASLVVAARAPVARPPVLRTAPLWADRRRE